MTEAEVAIEQRVSLRRIVGDLSSRAANLLRSVGHIALLIPLSVMCLPALLGHLPMPSPPSTELPSSDLVVAVARENFFKLLDRHLATQASLSNLAYLSLLCIGITLVVLSRRQSHALEIQGIHVPLASAYLAIAVIMTYLWVQYIWTLNRLVEEHRELCSLSVWLKPIGGPTDLRALLPSSPLIDSWARSFLPCNAVTGQLEWSGLARYVDTALRGAIIGGCAAAVGLAHACVFALLDDVPKRWQLAKVKRLTVTAGRISLCVVIVCAYVWFELQNRDWRFSIAAAWFAYIWVKLRGFLPSGDPPDLQAALAKTD